MYAPFNYENLNLSAGTYNPPTIKSRNNAAFNYWERALFQRAVSVFDFHFPDEWQGTTKDFILWVLFKAGFLMISEDVEHGYFAQPCTLKGRNFYYQPTHALMTNPATPEISHEYEIGVDCEILKLTPDYFGIFDIIDYYADKLAMLDNNINISLVNGKIPHILGAKNKSAANALKKILDLVNKGNPAVVFDQRIVTDPNDKNQPFVFQDLASDVNKYLLPLQLKDMQTIMNDFNTEIGIPTIPIEKKERMITDEAQSKEIEASARCRVWLETLKSSMAVINAHYAGLNLDVSLYYEGKGASENGDGENDTDRTV